MNRIVKLTVIGAAIAGAAVGTVAFLRRRGSQNPELVDYDELADKAGDAIEAGGDKVSATVEKGADVISDTVKVAVPDDAN
jgi:hypothetical protein